MHTPSGLRRRHGGALLKLVVFLIIFGAVVVAAWIFFMPLLLTSTLKKRTGFDVVVRKLVLNPFSAEVTVDGMVVDNPSTFPRRDYLRIRAFHAKAPLRTLWSDAPDIEYVRLDIEQIAYVRNREGTLNASLFNDRLFPVPVAPTPEPTPPPKYGELRKPTPTPPPLPDRPSPKQSNFRIQRLELKVDRVVTDDYASKEPVHREFDLAINQTFFNVTDAKQILNSRFVRALSPAATAITGLIPGSLGDVLNATVEAPPVKDPKKKTPAPDVLKSISDTLEETKKP